MSGSPIFGNSHFEPFMREQKARALEVASSSAAPDSGGVEASKNRLAPHDCRLLLGDYLACLRVFEISEGCLEATHPISELYEAEPEKPEP